MLPPPTSAQLQKDAGAASLDPRLLDLLQHLLKLPDSLSNHASVYPFSNFVLDPYDVEHYGSAQRALNNQLELIFGSRSSGKPIKFRGRGPSLEAVVYIFYKYINGEDKEDQILWRWVEDLTRAAIETLKNNPQPPSRQSQKKSNNAKRTGKRNGRQPRKKRPEAGVNASKRASAVRYPHDPADLEDDSPDLDVGGGRTRDELLDRLTIPCHSITDPSHRRVRCRGVGCGWSWAEPRIAVRILRHARKCSGLDADLCAEAKQRGARLSLAAKLQGSELDTDVEDSEINPQTQKQKEDRVNHALLKWLCDRMLPPSVVDCLRWDELVNAFDPDINTASGSTIADNFVSTEAAYIHNESVNVLALQDNITLSYDGGTTRKHESVYTVHATNPSTRDSYLMDGNEASGISHTAEHICSVIHKVLKEVGPERFASIVSDNAGNTRAARELIEQEYPWIITLQDACHHLNNAAKDVGNLPYFQACISKLRSIITHFHTSSYAARHLAALRVVHHITEGLVAIGNTRFASFYYAAQSALRCLPLIRKLISSEVLDPKPASPIYWMTEREAVQEFEEQLAQFASVLGPFARAIKCLESTHSTLSDVYVFWLAVLARFQDMFRSNQTLAGIGLPSSVIEEITSILNGRHTEMFQTPAGQVYLAAFFLDIRYRNSDILSRRSPQLSTENWNSQYIPAGADLLPDQDLRQSLPAYTMAGDYLVKLLGRVYNKDPDAPLFARYASWSQIEASFRNQLVLYTRGLTPFHRAPKPLTERTYWESLSSVPTAELLAHLGIILTSVVPNSMAEERTMSTLTKLNSPERASQNVSTLIDMAIIRQHYKREEKHNSPSRTLRPTVRFADLSPVVRGTVNPDSPTISEDASTRDIMDTVELLGDETQFEDPMYNDFWVSQSVRGNSHHFEVESTDGVTLSSKLLADLVSDQRVANNKHSHSPEPLASDNSPPKKRQRIDISSLAY